MGRSEYMRSRALSVDESFHTLIMAAMRRADSDNVEKLKAAFPETWDELRARYNAPGGVLPHEVVRQEATVEEKT